MRGGRSRWALAVVLLGAFAQACGGSGFRYVQNSDEHVYFKVPDDWQMYDQHDVITVGVANLDEDVVEGIRLRTWLRGFDAAPEPSPATVLDRASPFPRGYAEVRLLTRAERDNVSVAALRSWGFGFDPLQVAEQDPTGPVRLLHLEDISTDDGYHGVRLVVLLEAEGDIESVVDQTVLVDPDTTRLYRFTLGCLLECYREHQDLLTEIADSWTLEEI